ncbi:MAG: radical SAM protein [Candidatus Limiplasma sp.]|nr:radical SAM protein [Candidatus Limiplasma sp.]
MQARKLELVHFQLTRLCNLHCWFCGQWGEHGAFRESRGQAMTTDDWLAVIDSLAQGAQRDGAWPSVILWGGEPLLSESFEPVVKRLHALGAPLGMVTNGTLIDRHAALCREAFQQIYISVDGVPAVHDAIRGQGMFARVRDNLRLLRGGRAKITLMSVTTPELDRALPETLAAFEALQPDKVLLQARIGLQAGEVSAYQSWMRACFGQEAAGIAAWTVEEPLQPHPKAWYEAQLTQQPFPVQYLPHGREAARPFCLSPYRHAHVGWDGRVGFCTDFVDFSLGNVHETPLPELFASDLADRFAREVEAGHCATCAHCSWLNSETFGL